jgi:radical SAM protein with 4Fe4S-binding SPASM domain
MDDFGYHPLDPALAFLHDSWRGCIAGRELVGIRSNGDVLGCLSLGDEFVEANLRRECLADIWSSRRYFERFRHKERLLTGHCASCAFGLECRAGCSAMAHSATGSIGQNPYCLRHLETEELLSQLAALRGPQ